MTEFNKQYVNIIQNALSDHHILNERTGVICHTSYHQQITVDISNGIPLPGFRKTMSHVAAAEVAWALQGTTDPSWLQKYTKVWDPFITEDGQLESSYGFRWHKAFGIDQLDILIAKLANNSSSRQAVLTAWNPRTDLMVKDSAYNVPCPISYIFNIVDGHLYTDVILRSSDLVLGFPIDLVYFCLLNNLIANTLHIRPGQVSFRLSNAHVYDNHLLQIQELIKGEFLHVFLPSTTWTIDDVRNKPDEFVELVKSYAGHPKVVKFDMIK